MEQHNAAPTTQSPADRSVGAVQPLGAVRFSTSSNARFGAEVEWIVVLINEKQRRSDFKRVKWRQPSEGALPKTPEGLEQFVQLWFAGNHSDIGGGYPEDESRLSDIALEWMVGEAASLPHPAIFDRSKLRIYPSAAGVQHCEVDAFIDAYPKWWPRTWRKTWGAAPRFKASGAPYHSTVAERLALDTVLSCGLIGPYRPLALSKDPALAPLFSQNT